MRPARLVIEGFTSFRKAQEIDFSALDLFVITGPTGSGKTSILDAVSLALYGMVPRGGKQDVKELISLGTSQARVQLDFRVGGTNYRVARRIRKQGAQFATLERFEGETLVSEVDSGGVKPVNDRVIEILGLDYRSFTTAVLLPQGDFASFLKGDVKVRRRILIRLLSLDRFERAGKLARQKASELRTAVSASQELLSREYGDATSEALAEAKALGKETETAAGTVDTAYAAARSSLSTREKIGARHDETRELVAILETQETELEELASNSREESVRSAQARAAYQATKRTQSEEQEARLRARKAWNETVEETGTEAVLATLKAAADAVGEANQETKRRSEQLQHIAEALNDATSRAEQLQAKQESLNAAEVEAAQAHDAAADARGVAEEALRTAKRAEELGRKHKEKLVEVEALRAQVAAAAARCREVAKVRDQREAELRAIETEHRATKLRAHLRQGDLCPVCGVSIEKLPTTDAETESALAAHDSAARKARELVVTAERELAALRARFEEGEGDAKDLDQQVRELADALALEDAKAQKTKAADAESEAKKRLETEKNLARAILDEVGASQAELAALNATRREAEKARDLARERAEAANHRLIGGLGDPLPEAVDEAIDARYQRLQAAKEARRSAEATCETAEEAHRVAAEALTAATDAMAALDRLRDHNRTLLGERIDRLGRLGITAPAPPASADSEDSEAETTRLRAYAGTLREAADLKAAELLSELATLDASIRTHASTAGLDAGSLDAVAATSALKDLADEARRLAVQSAKDIEVLAGRIDRRTKMETEIEEKRGRMSQYEKVGNELQTDRFIGFLLDESVEDLALRASNELRKISAGQYSLTSSKNNFTVVDHANADERRSVVTLSGGETFLASLALALGLAQGIADIAGHSASARLDAMFIDEGFGMLDPDSLDQAVEALERLRDGERMVGLITHVPTLAERIPDGLNVQRNEGHTVVGAR
ncbi:MAG: SMC family ATPase [Holophagales bacterium]|nr:SMC family ATPase [Holophagales bacterium]MYC09323.1 SMC family ATPase [Holophagales bacterium]